MFVAVMVIVAVVVVAVIVEPRSGYGVRPVIEISRVRLPTGASPGTLGQLSLSSLRGR